MRAPLPRLSGFSPPFPRRFRVTLLEAVPSLAREYLPYLAAEAAAGRLGLRAFLTGGESLAPALAEGIAAGLPALEAGGPLNTYGPTECTVQERRGRGGPGGCVCDLRACVPACRGGFALSLSLRARGAGSHPSHPRPPRASRW